MNLAETESIDIGEELRSKYEFLKLLGGGGMGRVVLARHRQLHELVAIKLLQRDLDVEESVGRFLREARASAKIRSVHVARVMDTGVLASGRPYIVMEYLRGQDLTRWVETRGPLPAEQAVDFTLQALEAIAEAHALGIVHRDLKPANLFATTTPGGDPCIKVLDFGLAKTKAGMMSADMTVTRPGSVLGSPSYMSPEQFVDAQDVDPRSDIWSIGASLFELLTGDPPFRGSSLPQLYTAVLHSPIKRLRDVKPDLPEGLDAVINACLTREREGRYQDVATLAKALAPFGGAEAAEHVERIDRVLALTAERKSLVEDLTPARPIAPTAPGITPFSAPSPILADSGGSKPAVPKQLRPQLIAATAACAFILVVCLLWFFLPSQPPAATATTDLRAASTSTEPAPPTPAPPQTAPPQASPVASVPVPVPEQTPSARPQPQRPRPKLQAPPPPAKPTDVYERYP